MSRDWLAIYTALLTKPKYRRLSIPARGALFHIWLLAGAQSPEATWPLDDLADSLDLDGWDGADVIQELAERRWLDLDPNDDRVYVHDWDEHQFAVTEKVRTAYERDRKRDWRRRQREAQPVPTPLPDNPLPVQDPTGAVQAHDTTESRFVPDVSRTGLAIRVVDVDDEPFSEREVRSAECVECHRPTRLHKRTCSLGREAVA